MYNTYIQHTFIVSLFIFWIWGFGWWQRPRRGEVLGVDELRCSRGDVVPSGVVRALSLGTSDVGCGGSPGWRLWRENFHSFLGKVCKVSLEKSGVFADAISARWGYRCDRLLRTRIGCITGIPKAKAEKYLAVPAQEITTAIPAQLGDPTDLQSGEWLGKNSS